MRGLLGKREREGKKESSPVFFFLSSPLLYVDRQ